MSSNQLKYNVGDKVKVISYQNEDQWEKDYGVNVGDIVEIVSVNLHDYCVVSKTGKTVFVVEENLELVSKGEEKQEQTPYQEKGYTENSLFKFVGVDGQFELGEVIKLYSDDGSDIPDFKSVTRDRCRYCILDLEVEYIGEEGAEDMIPDYEEATVKGIVSDGGASDYYFTKLPQHIIDSIVITGGIEIKDIARYVYDNDADAFNIIKAEKRIIEERKGKGKLGCTALYDANKIVYFANEQYEAIKHTEESHG